MPMPAPDEPSSLAASFLRAIIGRPLASSEMPQHKIGVIAGVAAIGLDGLASASYGPEAALAILTPHGQPGIAALIPVFALLLALLAMVCITYFQTIGAYTVNGGSYS